MIQPRRSDRKDVRRILNPVLRKKEREKRNRYAQVLVIDTKPGVTLNGCPILLEKGGGPVSKRRNTCDYSSNGFKV
jgi:hypothetical protein